MSFSRHLKFLTKQYNFEFRVLFPVYQRCCGNRASWLMYWWVYLTTCTCLMTMGKILSFTLTWYKSNVGKTRWRHVCCLPGSRSVYRRADNSFLLLPPFPTKDNSFRLGSSDDCIWEASPASACVHGHYVDNNALTNLFGYLLEQNILHTHGPSPISVWCSLQHSWLLSLCSHASCFFFHAKSCANTWLIRAHSVQIWWTIVKEMIIFGWMFTNLSVSVTVCNTYLLTLWSTSVKYRYHGQRRKQRSSMFMPMY